MIPRFYVEDMESVAPTDSEVVEKSFLPASIDQRLLRRRHDGTRNHVYRLMSPCYDAFAFKS